MEILTAASWTPGAEPEGGEAAAGTMPVPRMARRRGGVGREEGEDVFRCGSCDEKRGERLETRGGDEGKRGAG